MHQRIILAITLISKSELTIILSILWTLSAIVLLYDVYARINNLNISEEFLPWFSPGEIKRLIVCDVCFITRFAQFAHTREAFVYTWPDVLWELPVWYSSTYQRGSISRRISIVCVCLFYECWIVHKLWKLIDGAWHSHQSFWPRRHIRS